MPEIIPAIIAKNFNELKEKIGLVEPHVKTVQLDVMDGVFVNNQTWTEPSDLEKLETGVALEAHLMVKNPGQVFNAWLTSPVKRIILHYESLDKEPEFFIKSAKRQGKQIGLALNPETPVEVLEKVIDKIDLVLLMSVNPGFAGQEFQESVLSKIMQLRQRSNDVKIGADGGINLINIRQLSEAGVDFLAVGSEIFTSGNVAEKIIALQQAIK